MKSVSCPVCAWSGWVCEVHTDRPSEVATEGGCSCGGAAAPCKCNPDAVYDFAAVFAAVDPESVKDWVH
ncbi:hypothetical protein WDL1P2_00385 (plasmid) [Variovorax sp. WDL1]|nr:hypothetical protein CHC06_06455 [Variovorax sp. B2]PNG49603.1 hypothetical protein CHC07_06512 [Variovorax sp. B4]VTV18727.1 hypothetical protein WDL1P2_00385 [Variovorax sp. WDL1]